MKNAISRFGKFLSGMVMPNIGAFIAWGFLTALFIEKGWFPNERLSSMVSPMLSYLLPILIAGQGGYMVAKERGRVIACIAVIGCICGSGYTMLMGAMVMGPLAGWVIKQFDNRVEEHIPAGFEMLVHNFSIGILGMLLAILGYYVIGPFMTAILTVLTAGVDFLVSHSLLPLVSIFIEPAKVLFLNNAINHGIFNPIGVSQAAEAGRSIMYMLETNPGPGLGVRCLGAITRDRLEAVRESDAILREEFAKNGLEGRVWQYFTAIPDLKSVGVKDNKRVDEWCAIIRAVNTIDAMTATVENVPFELLQHITDRITHEVKGINRVLFDLTPKPTGTIEWE